MAQTSLHKDFMEREDPSIFAFIFYNGHLFYKLSIAEVGRADSFFDNKV